MQPLISFLKKYLLKAYSAPGIVLSIRVWQEPKFELLAYNDECKKKEKRFLCLFLAGTGILSSNI